MPNEPTGELAEHQSPRGGKENPALVLLIHPDGELAGKIGDLLSRDDLLVVHARSGAHVEELIRDARPEVILCGPEEKLKDGRRIHELGKGSEDTSQCILLIERDEMTRAQKLALESEVYDYFLTKPAHDALRLVITVRRAVRHKRLVDENKLWETALLQFRQGKLAEEISAHRDGMVRELREQVDAFRSNVIPEGDEEGVLVVRDPTAFEDHYLHFRDTAVEEAVHRNASRVQSSLDGSLGEMVQKTKGAPQMSMEQRLAKIPPKLMHHRRRTARAEEGQKRVLLITLGLPNLSTVTDFLSGAGYDAKACDDLRASEVKTHGSGYDVVIIDLTSFRQPQEPVEHLRQLVGPKCKIVAASTKVTDAAVRACREAGADSVILLPIKPASLGAKLSMLLKESSSEKRVN